MIRRHRHRGGMSTCIVLFGVMLLHSRFINAASSNSYDRCEAIIGQDKKLFRDELAGFVFMEGINSILSDSDKSSIDANKLKKIVFDGDGEIQTESLPPYYLLPNRILQTFIFYACKYGYDSDEDMTDYCDLEDRDARDLPVTARIPLKNMNDNKKDVLIEELCTAVADRKDGTVQRGSDYFMNVIKKSEEKSTDYAKNDDEDDWFNDDGEKDDDEDNWLKDDDEDDNLEIPVSFSIRVETDSVSDGEIAQTLLFEIQRIIIFELEKSILMRRRLEETNAELDTVQITIEDTECEPQAPGISCYDITLLVAIYTNDEDAQQLQQRVMSSIQKDQSNGAYFSYLEGFQSLPPTNTAKATRESQPVQTKAWVGLVTFSLAFIAVIAFFAHKLFRTPTKEEMIERYEKRMSKQEIVQSSGEAYIVETPPISPLKDDASC